MLKLSFTRYFITLSSLAIAFWLSGCSPEKVENATPATSSQAALVRPHSPIIGPESAPVTLVEFLDPSCEGCRAFYPITKELLAQFPREVRLVVRYVPFHTGSEAAVRLLEAARMQGLYEPALEAVFEALPKWHNDAEARAAWSAAEAVGVNLDEARKQTGLPVMTQNLATDIGDARAFGITRTPTFFVNGKPVEPFGVEQLRTLVREEVEQSRSAKTK